MRVQYYTATSIDGFIADADHGLEWLFQFGGMAGESERTYREFLAGVGALVMGSSTYEWLLDHGVRDDPGQWAYVQPTWVLTHRDLPGVPGKDVRFAQGPVAELLPELTRSAGAGNLWVVGGGDLVGQFADLGRLDDVFLGVAPVFLGSGAPLLPRKLVTPWLELVELRRMDDFVFLHYTAS